MTPFTKILVPTDFSEGAQAAMRLASDLSYRFAVPLTLAYVFERVDYPLPNGYVVFSSQQFEGMVAEFEQRLAQEPEPKDVCAEDDVEVFRQSDPLRGPATRALMVYSVDQPSNEVGIDPGPVERRSNDDIVVSFEPGGLGAAN